MKTRSVIHSILLAELILFAPLLAMVFTDEVKWEFNDFLIAAVLLGGIGLAYRMVANRVKNRSYTVIFGIVLAALMILIWIELAVGIFGSPFAGS